MDCGTKQTEPLIGSANSRPPPFNTSDATPPQYSQAPPPPNYGGTTDNNTNVVVVTQPTYQSSPVVQRLYAPDCLGFSVFMLVCCLLVPLSWVALFCIIPALILSIVARHHNQAGRLDEAVSSGKVALGCNIAGLVSGILIVVGILLFVIATLASNLYYANMYNNNFYPSYPTNPTSWPNNN